MKFETLVVGPFDVNCYVIWDETENGGAILDPGDEDERIIDCLENNNIEPKAIILTHGHGDHIAGVEFFKSKFDIPIYIGRGDEKLLQSPSDNVSAFYGHNIVCPPADKILNDQDVFKIGSLEFNVIATPGHTPGGVSYLVQDKLFCGDTLFFGSVGRTDLPGGSFKQLIESIDKNILCLPDEIICLPGHGPATTIGHEKHNNPFLSGNHFV